jgi:hypothetical protein
VKAAVIFKKEWLLLNMRVPSLIQVQGISDAQAGKGKVASDEACRQAGSELV